MAKYEDPNLLDYRNGGDTVDDFAQKYMRTVAYIFKALNDLRSPTSNSAGVEPEPYQFKVSDNKLYIRNADNTDYILLGDISPNFGFRQSVNDRFLTAADLEGEGAVVTRNEAGKVEGDITGSPGKIANKTIDVTPSADNDVIAYDAAQQKWVKKTLNDYLKKQGDAGWDEMVDEVAEQVINDITPIIFNFWYLDDDGYLVPLVGSTEGGLPSIHGMVGDYEQITARNVEVAGNLTATGNVTAGMLTTPQANVTTLTTNSANVTTLTANAVNAGKVTADEIDNKNKVQFLFPKNLSNENGECSIVVTKSKVLMIDAHYNVNGQFDYLINYLKAKGIRKIDYFLLSHYHADHYENIQYFLAQSEIDFSETKFYIPKYTNSPTAKTSVINWLTSANVEYVELDSDITIRLDTNVTVDVICNSDSFHQAMIDAGGDLNAHSNYALVKHGKVNALFTGDGYGPEISYIVDNYDLPKVDLVKIQHHGIGSTYDDSGTLFYKTIAAKYGVVTWGTYQSEHAEWAWRENNGYANFVSMYGGTTYAVACGDVEFTSDGIEVTHDTANVPYESLNYTDCVELYVDASASLSVTPDGSPDKPYRTLHEAVKNFPRESAVKLYVAPGAYKSIRLENFNNQITLIRNADSGDITINYMILSNVNQMLIKAKVLTNKAYIKNCNVEASELHVLLNSNSALSKSIVKTSLALAGGEAIGEVAFASENSNLRMGKFYVDGTNEPDDIDAACGFVKGFVDIRYFYVDNITKHKVVDGGRSLCFSVGNIYVTNVSQQCIALYWGALVHILNASITNYTKAKLVNTGVTYQYGTAQNKFGTSANRPSPVVVPSGELFMDVTLNKLLICDNTPQWVDTTTGQPAS